MSENWCAVRLVCAIMATVICVVFAANASGRSSDIDLTPARSAIDAEDFGHALTLLQPIVSSKDADGESFYLLGLTHNGLGDYAAAIAAFERAVKEKFRSPDVYIGWAIALAKSDKIVEVEKLVEKPLSKAKTDLETAQLKYALGNAYLITGNYSKAQEWLLGARFDDEDNLEYRARLGDAYFEGQIYPLAVAEYEAVLSADSSRLDMLYRLADTYYKQQRLNEARPLLIQLLERDSTYYDAYFKLANIYMIAAESRTGDQVREEYKRALSLYLKVREVDPEARPILVTKNIAKVYYLLGAHDSAIVELDNAIQTGADDPELKFFLGRSNMLLGNNAAAVEAFKQYRDARESADPSQPWTTSDAELFWRMAVCMEAIGDSTLGPEIVQNYRRAVELNPDDERSIGGLALALHRQGQYAEAAVEFEKLVVRYPNDARVLFNASLPYLQSDNSEKAVEYLLRAAKNDTTADAVYRSRTYKLAGPRLIKMQRYDDARTCYKWLIEAEPAVCDNHKWYGFTLFTVKNYTASVGPLGRAYACYEKLEKNPCEHNELRWWLAYATYEAGDLDESYKLAKQVVGCDPSHRDAQDLMNLIDEQIVEEN